MASMADAQGRTPTTLPLIALSLQMTPLTRAPANGFQGIWLSLLIFGSLGLIAVLGDRAGLVRAKLPMRGRGLLLNQQPASGCACRPEETGRRRWHGRPSDLVDFAGRGPLCSPWACLPRQTIAMDTIDTDAFQSPETMNGQQGVKPVADTCDDRGTYVPPDCPNATALLTSMVVSQRLREHGVCG